MPAPSYQRSPHAVWRASASFLVAAVPPNPPTRIAGSAASVWALLAEPRTVDEVAALVAAQTDVPAGVVRADVAALIDQLLPLGLVQAST